MSIVVAGGVALAVTPAVASDVGCRVDYAVASQWSTGFTTAVKLTNLGSPVTGWVLGFDFTAGQQMTQGWNATWAQSGAHITATNASWNGSLGTGGAADIGFYGSWTGANPVPAAFTMNGVVCDGTVHGPSAPASPSTVPASPPSSTRPGDLPPVVHLTSPNSTSIYGEPGNIFLSANASDPDGVITKVEFYTAPFGGSPLTLVATVTTPPYTFPLTVGRALVFVIQAKAYDDGGLTATDTVQIHVAISDPIPSSTPPAP
ncbi:MAG: cellulose binding domain-containing protein [Micromonosporaceae bacterium]|nr:cellulose binding domain-containing protein [Micromonosporaceae bacterium]